MSKKATSTEVAVASQFTQKDIPSLIEKVNEQISALKGDKEKNQRITGELPIFGKVSNISDVNTLRSAYAYIVKKYEAVNSFNDVFKSAAPTIKLNVYKEGDATLEQWKEEIMIQFKEVVFKEQLEKLEKVKTLLTNNLSEELKLQASLGEIANILEIK